MKTLGFYGSSDDNFCYKVNGRPTDEFGCYDKPCFVKIQDGNQRLAIVGAYDAFKSHPEDRDACWVIGATLVAEGDLMPEWPIEFRQEHDYSPLLVISVPDSATIEVMA